MKALMASMFVLGSACFCGWSIWQALPYTSLRPSVEINIFQAEKGFSITPQSIYLQRRKDWYI